jgi:hypothetical protein
MEETSWVDFTITRGPIRGKDRNKVGLIIQVKARPDIEDFLRGLAHGGKAGVDAYGDMWQNVASDKPLEYYHTDTRLESGRGYSLEHIGQAPLITNERQARNALLNGGGPADEVVNLAFLRLVGVSSPEGITVGITGAYSGEYLRRIKLLLPGAVKNFLQDYVVPITINLQVISKG